MRILVTGGLGNVGSHTVPELLRRGYDVRTVALPSRAAKRLAARLGVPAMWGDLSDPEVARRAVSGVDTVVHLAAMIPPGADEQPERARQANVDGTAAVIAACQEQPTPPRLLFTSTLDVHGKTLSRTPPRHVDDPLVATNPYTEHKIEAERLVRESGLDWAIFRLADVPVLGVRAPHPIMFEIGLANRIEAIHGDDVALAIANALQTPTVWGRVLFIGGGPTCQLTYRDYLGRLLGAMGIPALPDKAFSTEEYATDWLDTVDSQALLDYQHHTFDDIVTDLAKAVGWRRHAASLAAPLVRVGLLRLSAYNRR